MKYNHKLLLFLFLVYGFIAFSVFFGAYHHELTHKEHYEAYGCKAHIEMLHFRPVTFANCGDITEEDRRDLKFLNRMLDNHYEFMRYDLYFTLFISLLCYIGLKNKKVL